MMASTLKKPQADVKSIISPRGVEMIYANELYCTYCPMVFSSISGRKRHEMYHEGKRPFSCEKCHASFHRLDRLLNHKNVCDMIDHFGEDNIKWCNYCDHFARNETELKNHYQKNHNVVYYPTSSGMSRRRRNRDSYSKDTRFVLSKLKKHECGTLKDDSNEEPFLGFS